MPIYMLYMYSLPFTMWPGALYTDADNDTNVGDDNSEDVGQ